MLVVQEGSHCSHRPPPQHKVLLVALPEFGEDTPDIVLLEIPQCDRRTIRIAVASEVKQTKIGSTVQHLIY